jgi:hypothetical protein
MFGAHRHHAASMRVPTQFELAAVLVVLDAVMPGMFVVPAVMITIPVTFARLDYADATGGEHHYAQGQKRRLRNRLENCHGCSSDQLPRTR